MTQGPPALRRVLGSWLRAAREAAGLSGQDAGKVIGVHHGHISRLESGHRTIKPVDMVKLLDAYGVSDKIERVRLERLAKVASQKDWFDRYGSLLTERGYRDWLSLEQHAAWARSYEVQVIPGLLQTEEYAREIFAAARPGTPAEDIDELVAARLARQKILTREDPFRFWVVVDEAALRRTVGNRFVHRAQLQRLVDIAEGALSSATVQVLPFSSGAHVGVEGAFTLLGFERDGSVDLVCLEGLRASTVLTGSEDLQAYAEVLQHLTGDALGVRPSHDLLVEIIKEL